ncbi:hypothetical protein NEUTE1DRAFT_110609 [Neurospora tetrasperma FGSC 2508]|uniref:Uncharacterized protein n=1 Tax=Neurospora tetrasperma (strain FGSC 2508 / ATCC MYA-4615 / P0657) TaxID=510951 RepID=F8MR70_NEUT8|nr:uncharacterized protein NEUTE1DRAFT_110609 [Neurospora tetrasperma FGSC 2508]EGO56029.1 hypothetical protein NEUTE1DRAFT_110609 [Neurospora tetrasperma FGSC 2508]EGZ71123.1 hypothetical protein NEUTE2DRAFT_131126 [Neurospora tetrasperma FGSC 2509]
MSSLLSSGYAPFLDSVTLQQQTPEKHTPNSSTGGNLHLPPPPEHEQSKKQRPSDRWKSYDDWKDNGPMRNHLERFMSSINKDGLKSHVEQLLHSPVRLSDRFPAGQHWCCFEFSTSDERRSVIARVRLPKHPGWRQKTDHCQ